MSAVIGLKAKYNSSSIIISWSPPFSLNLTGGTSGILYDLYCYNVTDEKNPTAINCTDCKNITETQYIFKPPYPSPCQKYFFTVIPTNGVGEGESSNNVTAIGEIIQCLLQRFEVHYDHALHFTSKFFTFMMSK